MWDKYRKVYYRFAQPKGELEDHISPSSYLDLHRNGGRQCAIMILDRDLQVIGETLLPLYTYNVNASFVAEDGLYLGIQSYNPDFNEDIASFQRFVLKEKSNKKE